ncbi:hypothetical protein D3G64_26995 [Escherichia coli]|nr:hypothetical protein [Escherichia coli]
MFIPRLIHCNTSSEQTGRDISYGGGGRIYAEEIPEIPTYAPVLVKGKTELSGVSFFITELQMSAAARLNTGYRLPCLAWLGLAWLGLAWLGNTLIFSAGYNKVYIRKKQKYMNYY